MALDNEPELSPSEDLRATIESAIDGGEPASTPPAAEPPSTPAAEPPKEPVQAREGRDGLGRFVAKKPSEAPGAPEGAPSTPTLAKQPIASPAPATPAQPAVAAPQSWSPTAREHWKTVPPAIQQEVVRREQEMARFVNDVAPARQLGERFYQAIQPYMATIQQEGVDPLTAVTNLMNVTRTLRSGTSYEKAQTVASIIKVYGVDIQTLDAAIVGQPMPQQQQGPDINAAVQQALAPLYQAAQARQQQTIHQAEGEARSELEVFADDPAHEFFQDLRGEMADIIEVAERQGRQMSLAQAYERAAMLHPEVSKVMLARQQGSNARQLTQAAQRARSAAVSVKGAAPVGNPVASEPTSIRDSIEAAIAAHSGY